MSAIPLPPLPVMPPTPTPAPGPPPSTQTQDGSSFSAHLHSAQHAPAPNRQQDHDAKQGDDGNGNGNGNSNASAQSGSTTKAGDSTASSTAQGSASASTDTDDDSTDTAANVDTLVSSMLSQIDHTSGDTRSGNTAPASGTGTKPATQASRQATSPQPPMPIAAMIPVAVMPAATPTATASGASSAPSATNAASVAGAAVSGGTSQKASIVDFSAEDDSGSNTATPAMTDAGAQAGGTSDGMQALAGSLTVGGHIALPAAITAAADSSTPGASDVSALGNLTATAPVMPSSATDSTHNLTNNAPVGSSGFAKELGQQVTWLSGQDVKQAQIRLNPQDLGPLSVKVSVEHGRVDVAFMTQHPATTAAVQQGLDQLNQMLGGQGLSLGHATVGQHAQQQFGGQQGQQGQAASNHASDEAAESPVVSAVRTVVGLVDAFA